jgi:hypothetical protein
MSTKNIKIELNQIVNKDYRVLIISSSSHYDPYTDRFSKKLYMTIDVDIDPMSDQVMETVSYELFDYNSNIPFRYNDIKYAIEHYNRLE